jgi:hypothetical protein
VVLVTFADSRNEIFLKQVLFLVKIARFLKVIPHFILAQKFLRAIKDRKHIF